MNPAQKQTLKFLGLVYEVTSMDVFLIIEAVSFDRELVVVTEEHNTLTLKDFTRTQSTEAVISLLSDVADAF